jgi:hypothetical protein
MTCRRNTPNDNKMRRMEAFAGFRQKHEFRPFPQALAFAE